MMVMMLVVRTIVMTVGTCQQDCPEEHSWWRCPSHFAAEDPPIKSKWENEKWKWKVKIPSHFAAEAQPINDDLDEKSNYDHNYDSNDKELDGKDLTDDQYYYNDKETVRAALKMVQDDADLSPNDGNPQGLACLPENINIIIWSIMSISSYNQ